MAKIGLFQFGNNSLIIAMSKLTSSVHGKSVNIIYMMGRTGLLLDPGVDACGSVYTPIWKKNHYKLQLMRPVKDHACRPIGMSVLGLGATFCTLSALMRAFEVASFASFFISLLILGKAISLANKALGMGSKNIKA
jgi:hypothetical protein